ncbi:TPA: hypothetical protein N0F65_000156 [Lagenidium giganteum]|uniref:Uncharacterized protein n=1 Tax=Lagenidium giganteum TaxID=4803 RepID=A0AAV2YHJ7_9STRA|nr:TPA: hypothetical protein N0F65_000156 [Lagenidium giganteum]
MSWIYRDLVSFWLIAAWLC